MKLTAGHSAGATAARGAQIHDEIETRKLAAYADELVQITQELRDTAEMIDAIESEAGRLCELEKSRDWRNDEIDDLHRQVADLRARIGVRA